MSRWHNLLHRFSQFNAAQIDFRERLLLRERPWEEEFLHWCWDGQHWKLHGHLPPPPGRTRSTTTAGWCQNTKPVR